VEIGEEDLASVELRPFLRLRLLDLDHHVGPGKDLRGVLGNRRSGRNIGGIIGIDAGAGSGLDQHLMAVADILADRTRRQPDPGLAAFDFLGNTDQHGILPLEACAHNIGEFHGVSVIFGLCYRPIAHYSCAH
jgi:hypothetical protein